MKLLRVTLVSGTEALINLDTVTTFTEKSKDITKIWFTDGDHVTVNMPIGDFVERFGASSHFTIFKANNQK